MKLYVWDSPYDVLYGDSFVAVMANNTKEARALAEATCKLTPGTLGKPDHVYSSPKAVLYHWEE